MLETLGIVQVPTDTARAKSAFRRKLGGKTLLEWVVRRVTDCQRLDGAIVVVGCDEESRQVARLVPPDVPVFASPHPDMLGRFAAALDEYPAHGIVRVHVDSPFVDPALIDRLVNTAQAHPDCDYISYCFRDGQPAIHSPVGVLAEWCRAKTLRKANRRATDPADRQHVTRFVYSRPETFSVRLIPVPAPLDRHDVRLTIDVEEDWDHAQDIYDALGPDAIDWQRIAGLLDQQPALRQRMAVLNRAAVGR